VQERLLNLYEISWPKENVTTTSRVLLIFTALCNL
jgi:hypothetical protein